MAAQSWEPLSRPNPTMAKINPANVAPDAYPRIRGVVLTRTTAQGIVVQKWPDKRGPSKTEEQKFLTKQFGLAGSMAANSESMAWQTAEFLSRGTVWMPRDILVMAIYGKLYELTGPDGQVFIQANHGWPGKHQPVRPNVLQWQPNQIADVIPSASNTYPAAFKGCCFVPEITGTLYAIRIALTPIAGNSYRACLATLSGSNVITAVTLGTAITIGGSTRRIYEFLVQANFTAGVRYAAMIGCTTQADAYVLPVPDGTQANYLFPCSLQNAAGLPFNSPAIGQTVSVGGMPVPHSLLIDN